MSVRAQEKSKVIAAEVPAWRVHGSWKLNNLNTVLYGKYFELFLVQEKLSLIAEKFLVCVTLLSNEQ